MTPEERERAAFLAGVQEGVQACCREARAVAARLRSMDPVRLEVLTNANTLELLADALERNPPMPEPTGLEYRGG